MVEELIVVPVPTLEEFIINYLLFDASGRRRSYIRLGTLQTGSRVKFYNYWKNNRLHAFLAVIVPQYSNIPPLLPRQQNTDIVNISVKPEPFNIAVPLVHFDADLPAEPATHLVAQSKNVLSGLLFSIDDRVSINLVQVMRPEFRFYAATPFVLPCDRVNSVIDKTAQTIRLGRQSSTPEVKM